MAAPKVLVWNEYRHERENPEVARIYPQGMHAAIAAALRRSGCVASTATLDDAEHGLSEPALAAADVLVWWGHRAHDEVADEAVERVRRHVMGGLGLVALHSAHYSKIFRRLMGTSCSVNWRVDGRRERLWVVAPAHPVAAGLDRCFALEHEEMYGEFFDIPEPDELVFISWFKGGEVFRSGCAWRRGYGRVFYFRPGHETFPTFHDPVVQRVIGNAVAWAAQSGVRRPPPDNCQRAPLELAE